MTYPKAKEVTTIYTKLFWKDFFERFISTMAQVIFGLMTAGALSGVPTEIVIQTIAGAAVATALKLLAAGRKGDTVSPASLAGAAPDLPAEEVDEDAPKRLRHIPKKGSANEL